MAAWKVSRSHSCLVFSTTPIFPNFYLANLEIHPFLRFCWALRALGLRLIINFFFLGGGPLKYPSCKFWFSLILGWGVPLGPSRCVTSKSCKKAKATGAWFQGGRFYKKMLKFKNFGCPLAFWPHFLRPWAKNQYSAPNSLFTSLFQIRKGATLPPAPKASEEIDLAETPFLRVRADPGGPGVKITCRKITCEELSGPWKFDCHPMNISKVIWLSSGDAQMHRRTDAQMHRRTDAQTHRHTDTHLGL